MTTADLKKMFDSYQSSLPRIVRECKESVTDWRWATDLMVSPEPLHDLVKRHCNYWRLPNRRWVNREVDAGYDATVHGFDGNGQLSIWRYRNAPGHYRIYGENVIDELFDSQAFTVTRYFLQDGKVTSQYNVSKSGWTVEHFERIGGRYVSSSRTYRSFHQSDSEDASYFDLRKMVYDDLGELDRVTEQTVIDGNARQPRLLFIRPREETLVATLREFEDLLAAQIPEAIRLASPKDPLYCVVFVYCGEDFFWPTSMCVGTESLRRRLLNEEDPEWRHKALIPGEWGEPKLEVPLWSPSAHDRADELRLRSFQLIDALDVFLEGDALRPARELLHRVARRLMQIDWTQIARVTDDFIAYAIDDTGEYDASEDIQASVPSDRIAILREQGYRWL